MAKPTAVFMCSSCGNEFSKWSGRCPACGEWNTITEVTSLTRAPRSSKHGSSITPEPKTPTSALSDNTFSSFPTNIPELDRVLGEGITSAGVFLLAGQPGIGKSTLLTQLAISLKPTAKKTQNQNEQILYICSEETSSQVSKRISRLSTQNTNTDHIQLLDTSCIENIYDHLQKHPHYKLIIIDSIQSVYTNTENSTAGSIVQIKTSANLLIQLAKTTSIPIILVGHVTKSGTIAGPKLLEHMVDAVFQLEGDRHHDLRLLRSIKNRFGPTDETGIFQMTSSGLTSVTDPNLLFDSSITKGAPGSAKTIIMEGTRPMLAEIQALTVSSEIPIPRRVAQGIPISKLQLICAILQKHKHLRLGQYDVFVNVTSGISIKEPAADLAIALAILSSYKNKPLSPKSIAIGELGLLGEVRAVPFLDKRLKQAKALGHTNPITSKNTPHLKQFKL